MSKGNSIPQVPSLDGLRGIAILLVLFLHFDLLSLGWVGVQLFFVLSGFLICSNLLLMRDNFSSAGQVLRLFYWKRVVRIFPLYYLVLLLFFLFQASPAFPAIFPDSERVGWPAFAANFFYLGNYAFFGYLPASAGIKLLAHFWSLAVEEQFYLLFPWLVVTVRKETIFRIAIALLVACPLMRAFFEEGYKNTICQFDSFGVGICLSFVWRDQASRGWLMARKRATAWLCSLALTATLLVGLFLLWKIQRMGIRTAHSSFGYDPDGLFHKQIWVLSLFNLLSGLGVLVCLQRPSLPWLSSAPLRYVGRISYGLYVIHYPLAQAVQPFQARWQISSKSPLGILAFLGYFAILTALAQLSFRYWELPFLRWKGRYQPKPSPGAP